MTIEKMIRIEENKVIAKIPVTYSVWGEVELSFDSIQEMKTRLNDDSFVENIELPENPQYVQDSFRIDTDEVDYQLSLLSNETNE